jgi:hypothetical protein
MDEIVAEIFRRESDRIGLEDQEPFADANHCAIHSDAWSDNDLRIIRTEICKNKRQEFWRQLSNCKGLRGGSYRGVVMM